MRSFLVTILVLIGVVLAQESLALTISPPKFELEGDRGSIIKQVIKIFNETTESKLYYPSLQDFMARGEAGEPGWVEEPTEYGLSPWIKIGTGPISLGPKERKEIQFSIEVPDNAEPGGHYAAIMFSTQPPTEILGATPIAIAGKLGSLVLLRVGGEITEQGKLLEFNTKDKKSFFTHLPVDFYLRFENLGNVHLKPQGTLKITGILDITATPTTLLVNEAGGNALPKSIRRYDITWTRPGAIVGPQGPLEELKAQWKGFAIGKFTAHLNLFYGTEGRQVTSEKSFWVFPWLLILVMAIVLAGLIFGLKFGIRKYNAWIIRKYR